MHTAIYFVFTKGWQSIPWSSCQVFVTVSRHCYRTFSTGSTSTRPAMDKIVWGNTLCFIYICYV